MIKIEFGFGIEGRAGEVKTCPKCNVPKEETEFHKRTASKDGLQRVCKECSAARSKLRDPVKSREQHKKWASLHPGYSREYNKKYRILHPNFARDKSREWRQADPERARIASKVSKLKTRGTTLKRMYGIGIEEWDEMMLSQGGECAVCHKESKLGVDHDHVTGKVRGLLCGLCNRALGLLRDSGEIAHSAGNYLTDWVDKQRTV